MGALTPAFFSSVANAADHKPKCLVIWYSKSGNTEGIGRILAEIMHADTFTIIPERFYGRERPKISQDAKRERETKDFPKLKGPLPDVSQYDLVFVGSPAWWYGLATPVMAFLDAVDFKGTRVAGFNTYGGDGHLFAQELKAQAKNAVLLGTVGFNGTYDTGSGEQPDGLRFQMQRKAEIETKLKAWLTEILPENLRS